MGHASPRASDRRRTHRYELGLPVHYRASLKGEPAHVGSSVTFDISTSGISFRSRRTLPIGAHVEMVVEWPARYADVYPIDLQVTGFVVRSDPGRCAVSISSLRFRTGAQPSENATVNA